MGFLKKPILIIGASGRTGRRVVDRLIKRRMPVRCFVRSTQAAHELLAGGVAETVIGDLLNSDDLNKAIHGTDRILHICPPMHPREDEIASHIIRLSEVNNVKRIVLYSVLHPEIDVPHHRRKLAAERELVASKLSYTILQPCRYMQHLSAIWADVVGGHIHEMPFDINARFSLVHLGDVAEAASIVLSEEGHEFATYQLCGPTPVSQSDCARLLSNLLGAKIEARRKPTTKLLEEAKASGISKDRLECMVRMNEHYDAHGLVGNSNVLRWLLGRDPTSFGSFVLEELIEHTSMTHTV